MERAMCTVSPLHCAPGRVHGAEAALRRGDVISGHEHLPEHIGSRPLALIAALLLDDAFYGIRGNHYETLPQRFRALTRERVNAVIRRHIQCRNVKVVFVTNEARALKRTLLANAPTPITYENPKAAEILEEDRAIEAYPLNVTRVTIVDGADVFETP